MRKLKKRIGDFKETRGIAYQAMHQFSMQVYYNVMLNAVSTPGYIMLRS